MTGTTTAIAPAAEQAIYIVSGTRARGASAQIDVRIASETVWLEQAKIARLFDVTRENINTHLANIYREGELDQAATCKENLQVRTEGGRQVRRKVLEYNLDAIISVGYRINSKTATAFRQWATRVLKQHLAADYKRRIEAGEQYLAGLRNVELLAHQLDADARVVLDLIGRYARSWRLLLQYDEDRLPPPPTQPSKRMARLTPKQANEAIDRFKKARARSRSPGHPAHERQDGPRAAQGLAEDAR